MDTTQNKPVFSTDNFALAIFLKTQNCNLLHIDKNDSRHASFVFENTTEIEKLTQNFWEGKGLIEPRLFYSTQKELKSFLYDNSYPVKT